MPFSAIFSATERILSSGYILPSYIAKGAIPTAFSFSAGFSGNRFDKFNTNPKFRNTSAYRSGMGLIGFLILFSVRIKAFLSFRPLLREAFFLEEIICLKILVLKTLCK